MRRLLTVVLALAFVPAASAGLPNPCALLTNAEVAKALGSKIVSREPDRYHSCTWTGADLGGYYPAHRTLMVQVSSVTKAQFDKSARQTPGALPVRGIGQDAFADTGHVPSLNVWQHGDALWIAASLVNDPLQTAKLVAKIVVKRI